MTCRRSYARLSALALVLLLTVRLPAWPAHAQGSPEPTTVSIPGTIQSKLGCDGDWQPACEKTFLTYDAQAGIWEGTFELPAGAYEYKAALNKTWDENYGLNAARGGANIPLVLSQPARVTFRYDHRTHWVADSAGSPFATVIGSFSPAIGCGGDRAATCPGAWLQDPDGDGTFALITSTIPAGSYDARVQVNGPAAAVYGAGGAQDGPAVAFSVSKTGDEIFFGYDGGTHMLTISTEGAPKGDLRKARAHWVAKDTISWNVIGSPKYRYSLFYDPGGKLDLRAAGITGGTELPLAFSRSGPGDAVIKQFPHLGSFTALKLPPDALANLPAILKGQLAVAVRDENGKMLDAAGLQIPGVLDDLYHYDGPLGVAYAGATPTLRVWAPTARAVALHLFADATTSVSTTVALRADPASGVWSAEGTPDWTGQYYLYEVEVYVPVLGKVVQNLVTDPYSVSLAANSTRSQIVNLADASLKPAGWDAVQKPALAAPEDIVLYELHMRDFSIFDTSVPAAERGTFMAFTHAESNGMRHLKRLATAGVTHVHLLPAFDLASIEEDRARRQEPDPATLAALPPDSDQQQALIGPLRDKDGYNWGYDPFHYTTPEGSYASDPNGPARIREFRAMVQSLGAAGLRTVMDVVYNHTSASGQDGKSVFDKIVPGYYYRLNNDGAVETSTCCQNTASEHAMMRKLMIDSLRTWAVAYKVDGFRFDLMGHHMVDTMQAIRAALDTLTPARDGVDGKQIYLYGEGWDFGEVANNARGKNATQLNMAGTGIGTFNDRLRDAVRGGGPFSGIQEQGFATGLLSAPNGIAQGTPDEQKDLLLKYTDWIKLGLAGNLKTYTLTNQNGEAKTGEQVQYNGRPAGYTLDPQENIVYVSAHDNETLFDAVQLKAPASAPIETRARMANLGLSLALLSQGVPFIHAGDEILRSKSLDRNSYNSGDWFNRLDWAYATNNWGVGLPPAGDNQEHWPLMQPLLANPALRPAPALIQSSLAKVEELLQIRSSSRLFRLRTAAEVQQQLSFLNNGPAQVPGLIVMRLQSDGQQPDDRFGQIVVLFNGNSQATTFADAALKGSGLALHPAQAASSDRLLKRASFDNAAGSFSVPGYTTAVFVGPAAAPAATAVPLAASTPTTAPAGTTAPAPTSPPAATPAPASSANRTGLLLGGLLAILALASAIGAVVRRGRKR